MDNSEDFKYVQQHLANERTFLAWIRTSVTIVGLGFLAAGVVFRSTPFSHAGHLIAACVGIGAVFFGGAVMAIATKDYFVKRTGINNETFRSTTLVIWIIFIAMGLIDTMLVCLVAVLLY
jgi:putative membrane protein